MALPLPNPTLAESILDDSILDDSIMADSKIDSQLATVLAAIIAVAAAVCSFPVLADEPTSMPTFSISYILENQYITGGEAEFRLVKKDDHYQLVLETKPTGVFRLSKKGKIKEIAELPSLNPPFLSDKYSYINFGDQDRSYTSMYNRKKGEATIVRNNSAKRMAIDVTAVDRVSMTLALMQQLRDQPDIQEFSVTTLDTNGTQNVGFVSKGQVSLNTRLGKLTTTRIDRLRNNSNRNTVTWFAALGPDKLPVPVQIEQYKRGKMIVRLKITDLSVTN